MLFSLEYTVHINQAGALIKECRYPGTEDDQAVARRVYQWLEDEQLLDCVIEIFVEPAPAPHVPVVATPSGRGFIPRFTPTFVGVL